MHHASSNFWTILDQKKNTYRTSIVYHTFRVEEGVRNEHSLGINDDLRIDDDLTNKDILKKSMDSKMKTMKTTPKIKNSSKNMIRLSCAKLY